MASLGCFSMAREYNSGEMAKPLDWPYQAGILTSICQGFLSILLLCRSLLGKNGYCEVMGQASILGLVL